ncbi:RuvC family protein [Sansalvadorimonas verongulae]|uniref:hypothetical protein n=1 Tax=Sansalvadorimonas verongulae TaxID=2172824 RepID=UPI0018AD2D99|nr:hypothetical protein [Sansalvadorimonas verongulae]
MMKKAVIGFDPGLSGAFAVLNCERDHAFFSSDFPIIIKNDKRHIDIISLTNTLQQLASQYHIHHVFIENVNAMPPVKGKKRKPGNQTSFTFGRSFGVLEGIVGALGLPTTLITPATWKRRAGLLKQEKVASLNRALELYPGCGLHLKKHIGRAEAMLIARYGQESL